MDLVIKGAFKNAQKETIYVEITDQDIEDLIISKAKDMGYTGYEGKIMNHFDAEIESINMIM